MTDVTNNVQTVFTAVDKSTGPLGNMSKAASRVSGLFNSASRTIGGFGAVAGAAGVAFSAASAVKGTLELLQNVKKVQDYTKMSAENAGGLLDYMEQAGISGSEATRSLMMMSKAATRVEMSTSKISSGTSRQSKLFQKLGIDIHKGPAASLERVSELAQQHEIDANTLSILYRMNGETARKFMEVLEKGPGHLKKTTAEFQKLGITTQNNVDAAQRIQQSQRNIRSLWSNIQAVVAVQLLPVIEKLLKQVEGKLGDWLANAQKFGKTLGDFLENHLQTVMKISKVLMLNFILMRATGKGMGDWGGNVLAKIMPMVRGGGAAKAATTAARAAGGAPSILTPALGTMANPALFQQFVSKIPGLTKVFSVLGGAGSSLLRFALMATKLTVIGVAIGMVIAFVLNAVKKIRGNVDGVRDRLVAIWETIVARFSVIGDLLSPVFDGFGMIADFWGTQVVKAFEFLAEVVDGIVHVLQTVILLLKNIGRMGWQEAWEETARLTRQKKLQLELDTTLRRESKKKKELEDAAKERKDQNFDFRGSRFDITQKFAEGFDPDRVAVAFASDLATLGERKLQSGFTPLYAIR